MPCPTHDDLLKLAFQKIENDSVEDATDRHARDCVNCQDRLMEYVNVLRRMQHAERMRAQAPATNDCLDDNDLAAYSDGGLAEADRDRVESHLVRCARCLDGYVQLSEILVEVSEKPLSSIAFVVELARNSLRLISHPSEGFTVAQLAPASILGSDETGKESTERMQAWTQTVGNYAIGIAAIQKDESHANVSLTIAERGDPLIGAALFLRCEGRTVQSETLDKSGKATITALALGSYECAITPPRQTAITFDLTLLGSNDE